MIHILFYAMIDDIFIQLFLFWCTWLNLEISEFLKISTGVQCCLFINSVD